MKLQGVLKGQMANTNSTIGTKPRELPLNG